MDEQTQLQIIAQVEKLPADVREAILSINLEQKLQEITRRQHLLVDQAGSLEIETTLVMIGLEPLANFVTNLQKNLDISIIRAQEIAFDVSENIFKPIRISLQKMNSGETLKKEEVINRDQVLAEIENPIPNKKTVAPVVSNPPQAIEKIEDNKYQQDFAEPKIEITTTQTGNSIATKMAGINITSQATVENTPNTKLPNVEKRLPTDNVDPYREPIQ